MKRILEELNEHGGVRGSMVITQDGIMVCDALGPDLEEDVVAALASSMIMSMRRGLKAMGYDDNLCEYVLDASDGKMVFLDMGNAFLVVVLSRNIRLNTTLVEIRSAAYKIKHRRVA